MSVLRRLPASFATSLFAFTALSNCPQKTKPRNDLKDVYAPLTSRISNQQAGKNMGVVPLMGSGYKTVIDGIPCTTNADGFCNPDRGKSDTTYAIFQDGYVLSAPNVDRMFNYYRDAPVTSGKVAYKGKSYTIQYGFLRENPEDDPVGYAFFSGTLVLWDEGRFIAGDVTQLKGLAARFEDGGYNVYDSFPESGQMLCGEVQARQYQIRNGLIFDERKMPAGSINGRGEVSRADGGGFSCNDANMSLTLRSDQGEALFTLFRKNAETQFGQSRVYTSVFHLNGSSRELVSWHEYYINYFREHGTFVNVRIKPIYFAEAFVDIPVTSMQNGLTSILQEPLGNASHINFSVSFTDDGIPVQFYRDTTEACRPLTPGSCHVIRPSTHQISIDDAERRFPHEYLHYLGNPDEYSDHYVPERFVTQDDGSLMRNIFGAVRERHFAGVHRALQSLLQPEGFR